MELEGIFTIGPILQPNILDLMTIVKLEAIVKLEVFEVMISMVQFIYVQRRSRMVIIVWKDLEFCNLKLEQGLYFGGDTNVVSILHLRLSWEQSQNVSKRWEASIGKG